MLSPCFLCPIFCWFWLVSLEEIASSAEHDRSLTHTGTHYRGKEESAGQGSTERTKATTRESV